MRMRKEFPPGFFTKQRPKAGRCTSCMYRVGTLCEKFKDIIPAFRKSTNMWCHAFRPLEEKEKAYAKD